MGLQEVSMFPGFDPQHPGQPAPSPNGQAYSPANPAFVPAPTMFPVPQPAQPPLSPYAGPVAPATAMLAGFQAAPAAYPPQPPPAQYPYFPAQPPAQPSHYYQPPASQPTYPGGQAYGQPAYQPAPSVPGTGIQVPGTQPSLPPVVGGLGQFGQPQGQVYQPQNPIPQLNPPPPPAPMASGPIPIDPSHYQNVMAAAVQAQHQAQLASAEIQRINMERQAEHLRHVAQQQGVAAAVEQAQAMARSQVQQAEARVQQAEAQVLDAARDRALSQLLTPPQGLNWVSEAARMQAMTLLGAYLVPHKTGTGQVIVTDVYGRPAEGVVPELLKTDQFKHFYQPVGGGAGVGAAGGQFRGPLQLGAPTVNPQTGQPLTMGEYMVLQGRDARFGQSQGDIALGGYSLSNGRPAPMPAPQVANGFGLGGLTGHGY
jgi:hypothetical protein